MMFFLWSCVESQVDVVIGGDCEDNCTRFERGEEVEKCGTLRKNRVFLQDPARRWQRRMLPSLLQRAFGATQKVNLPRIPSGGKRPENSPS